MKKRFFKYLLGISLLTLFLSTIASMFIYYSVYVDRSNKDLSNIVMSIGETLNRIDDDEDYLKDLAKKKRDFRITLIKEDGDVIFDSSKDPKLLPTHSDRPEVIKAKKSGFASVERYSNTLSKDLYYVSLKLDDGNIIRVSREMDNLLGAFTKVLPIDVIMSILVFIVAALVSKRLTKKTFEPLNNLKEDLTNINTEKFPEISPFINKINKQNKTIKDNYKEIRRERDTIDTILKNMKESLIIIDENKNLLSVNNSAKELFNSKRELIGENILNLIRDDELLKLIDDALMGKSVESITNIGNREFKFYVNPVFEDKKVRGVVILLIDETEEIRALRLREEFSSNVSHELKTPLTSICGFSELLVNGMVDEENKNEFYKLIYDDSKRLLNLIEDIMKISGLESDEAFSREEIDLRELISDILKAQRNLIEEKNISTKVTGNGKVFENKTMMWELFANIINNGLKYNKDNGKLDVKIDESEENYEVLITDTGIGIPSEDLSRIFERFYRVDKSRSRKIGGTGLGLSIVKHVLQSIDGKLEISSKLGMGTSFKIILKKNRDKIEKE
ncbi:MULTISPECIES: cell wall metabolism sensor histidine kinase WalK [Peptoniphilus]|jgi:two-component sensor histidine kinase|uniref:sensor histidine kinase n=1 Tax=Peptoniphilus TaxID=162289 RepID=UPI000289E408|nr:MULTISPECIES: ATP-binding protein [Peptoniphilus]MBS6610342.1 PAS domain-containing protein [Peptoniphilus harei]MDU1043629.1 ATP-binding protein [Peptoniphilus rhinitidis]MDU1954542.1 ATP-binding protein [Peptoniphilus lacydonensis]MDU2109281.1 ATP-binding protein [Peptoniphilus lacydonensis]MDU3751614.1 ATP-binding protein [Peptoniphilus rhinitidis]